MADPSTDVITPTPAAPPTAGIDMSNLSGAIRSIVPSSEAQIKSAIGTLGEAADKITGIASGYQAQAQDIQQKQSQVFDAVKAVHTEMQASSFLPPGIKRIVGYFDHTYSDAWHKEELAKNSVTLQDLQAKLDNAKIVKDSAIQEVTTNAGLAIQKATLSEEPLNLVQKAITAETSRMQSEQLEKNLKLENASLAQLKDPSNPLGLPPGLIEQEITKRGTRDITLSNLKLVNESEALNLKNAKLADQAKMLPDEAAINASNLPNAVKQNEIIRRQSQTTEEAARELGVRIQSNALHDKLLSDLAGTYSARQIDQLAADVAASPTGKITLTTGSGEAIPVTTQQIASMKAARVKADQAAREEEGKIGAARSMIDGNIAQADTQLDSYKQINPTGISPALDAEVRKFAGAAKAAASVGAYDEAKKNTDSMLGAIKTKIDDLVGTYPKESQGYVRQVAENGEGQQGAAAPFVIQNFVTPGANVGGYYHNISSYITNGIVDQAKGSGAPMVNGKIDITKMMEQAMLGPVKADETMRQLAAAGVSDVPGTKEMANGKPVTVMDKIVGHNFARYMNYTITKLASDEESLFGRYVDPKTGQYSGTIVDANRALDTTKMLIQLQKDSIDLERQGKLRPGQNLVDTLIATLADDVNKEKWFKGVRSRMTLEDKAVSAAFLKNREDWAVNANIRDIQNKRASIIAEAQSGYRMDENLRNIGRGFGEEAGNNNNKGKTIGQNIADYLTNLQNTGRP